MISQRINLVKDEITPELSRLTLVMPILPAKILERISQWVKVDVRENILSGQVLGIQKGETRRLSVFYRLKVFKGSVKARLTAVIANLFENFKNQARRRPFLALAERRLNTSGMSRRIMAELVQKVASGAKASEL